jgi:hypothetical protein
LLLPQHWNLKDGLILFSELWQKKGILIHVHPTAASCDWQPILYIYTEHQLTAIGYSASFFLGGDDATPWHRQEPKRSARWTCKFCFPRNWLHLLHIEPLKPIVHVLPQFQIPSTSSAYPFDRALLCRSKSRPPFYELTAFTTRTPDHLLLDRAPNSGPRISRWELDKFKNCWNKSFRTFKILTLLYQQFSNLLISQRDMNGPRLGALSNNRWSGSTSVISLKLTHVLISIYISIFDWYRSVFRFHVNIARICKPAWRPQILLD